MAARSEVRDLISKIRAANTGDYVISKSGRDHYKIKKRSGAPFADGCSQITMSQTPSDNRWREKAMRQLLAAGVFEHDPYKPTPSGKNGKTVAARTPKPEPEPTPEPEPVAGRHDDNRVRTQAIRARVEQLIVKLGGWAQVPGGSGVTIADFTRVFHHWAQTTSRDVWPRDSFGEDASFEAAQQMFGLLRRPETTLGQRWLPALEQFMTALEEGAGDPPDYSIAMVTYFKMLRVVKVAKTEPEPTPEPEPVVEVEPEPEYTQPVEPDLEKVKRVSERVEAIMADEQIPTGVIVTESLAREALFYMAFGADIASKTRILEIARTLDALVKKEVG